mgnify:CR=1 FL=1
MSEDTNPNTDESVVDLTLQDLASIKSIIDIAQSRGAFKTSEMVPVGTVASKLEKFLEMAAKQSQAAQASNQAAQAPEQASPNA